jgi:hypothetical protein
MGNERMIKSFLRVFLSVTLLSGLLLVSAVDLGFGQGGLVTFITTDTVWTKANSPYNLTGPVVVSTGATLTIEPGVAVEINGYDFFVNGTLQAIGSISDNIQISGGEITFGDNDQTGLNSILENTIIDSTIYSSKPLKLNNNTINARVDVGANSIISNNVIETAVNAGNNATISGNSIKGDVSVTNSATISDNTIEGDVETGSSAKILHNTINGSRLYPAPPGGHGYTIALTVGGLSEISNNIISGGVEATESTISNNTISGGAPFTDWGGRGADSTSAVTVKGNSAVTFNVISSSTGGYGVMIRSGYAHVSGNVIRNNIRVAGDALIENNLICDSGVGIQVGHIIINAFNTIDYGYGDSIIRNNVITNNTVGIISFQEGGTATIEHNLISNNTFAISAASQMSILNNTITISTDAITLRTSSVTIAYNNIMNYTQNSVELSSVSSAVNAAHNWWGTTDVESINLSIRDFKYDIDLGTVSFMPLLNIPNPEAPSTSFSLPMPPITPTTVIPEFSSLTILAFVLIATLVIVLTKGRLTPHKY